ncbi:helix-turn-helix transcriptional regulator [Candidatus Woesearchaeota archaeon]|nr:helix-turn-helix transcriptional regulator [Candidatus Woesearchaeota archaeon]
MVQRITIIRRRLPSQSLNEELQWLGSSLGLFNTRDRDKSCFRIFIELLKTTKQQKPLSSDSISTKLSLSRGTVVHHLHKLQEAGIVVIEHKGYILRVNNLKRLVDELEHDMERTLEDIKEIADRIDQRLQ